jgi:trimeric autotransporter adhesin
MNKLLPNRKWVAKILLLTIIFFSCTHFAFAQPVNNNCANAVLLTSNTSCINTAGTVQNATNSGIAVAPCTGVADDDVWYRFVTTSTDHTITLSNIGANLNTSGPRLQLFQGTCAGFTSVACGTTSIAVTTLARNTTYYIRVYSNGGAVLTSNAGFNICVTHPAIPTPQIDFGKSYINTTKPTGGTVETGDELEIRASFVVRSGSFDSCRFMDAIPAGTIYIPGTLRVLTNEGKIYKSFTDAQFDAANDQGWIIGSNITINLGYRSVDQPATLYRRGRVRNNNSHKPSFYGNTCILMASYRVQVTAAINTFINLGGGNVTYTTTPPVVNTFTFPSRMVSVYTNFGICSNTIGVNALGTEFNGTFGTGNLRNRGTSVNVPTGYSYTGFTGANAPNDYSYGIANNTSTQFGYSTVNTWPKPDPDPDGAGPLTTHRVFSVWDIIGDHTGAASPVLGNPATDTTGGRTGGYMLVINAAYRIDSAFQHTITGLCANTYYEVSCWMRNICSKCGCDSNGVGASGGAGYLPTGPGDSSGVRPNLAMALDGVDYYTTGDLPYNGQWTKKGFTFLTGPSQTSFTMRFYNNSPGGGGNDWALDDITIATCSPNMQYSVPVNPIVCDSNTITIRDTVRSYFNNYVYYKWQRSANGVGPWVDVTAPLGPATPYWNGSAWEYVSSYTLPVSATQLSNNGDFYRLVVATTVANLNLSTCRFTDAGYITINVIDCGNVLDVNLFSFSGRLVNERAALKWTTTGEDEPLFFEVEKSMDGISFSTIATINSYNDYTSEQSIYSFTDPSIINGKAFYRIKMKNITGQTEYSRIIQLSLAANEFSFISVTNPFSNLLEFDVLSDQVGSVDIQLIDATGKMIKRKSVDVTSGTNSLVVDETGELSAGIYFLRVHLGDRVIQKRVMKQTK